MAQMKGIRIPHLDQVWKPTLDKMDTRILHYMPQIHSPSAAFVCDNVLYHTLDDRAGDQLKSG